EGPRADAKFTGDQAAGFRELLDVWRLFGHRDRDAVRGEHELCARAIPGGEPPERFARGAHGRLVALPTRLAAIPSHDEPERAPHARAGKAHERIDNVWLPVAHPDFDRQRRSATRQLRT